MNVKRISAPGSDLPRSSCSLNVEDAAILSLTHYREHVLMSLDEAGELETRFIEVDQDDARVRLREALKTAGVVFASGPDPGAVPHTRLGSQRSRGRDLRIRFLRALLTRLRSR